MEFDAKDINIDTINLFYSVLNLDAKGTLDIKNKISGIGYVNARATAGNFDKLGKINIISGENDKKKIFILYKNGKKVEFRFGEKEVVKHIKIKNKE